MNVDRILDFNRQANREHDDEETMKFLDFTKERGFTADQMREAYYRLCGISDVTSDREDEPLVVELLEKMQEMVQYHFPIDRFAKLINGKSDFEKSVESFHSYVESLTLSYNEKSMLKSIVDKMRTGEFQCFIDGDLAVEFTIANPPSKEDLAFGLTEALREMISRVPQGKKYEFTFSEAE
ncbi:MAG: hypothetical protein WCG84_04775 [Candidatus Moraniibacteriota bacterium]